VRWHQIAYPKTHAEWIASAALLPISWLHSVCWRSYEAVYRFGFKRRRGFDLPIIGVGNLTAGGAGKTPLVIELIRLANDLGMSPAVSASAYGSPSAAGTTVLKPGDAVDVDVHGDEPAQLRQEFPNLPIVLGRNRVGAARAALENGFESLILDDGFQHLPLGRTADLVIWDDVLTNKRMIPAGPMRESTFGLNRASAVATPNQPPTDWAGTVFLFDREYVDLRDVASGEATPLSWLEGREVDALCAIALPEPFFQGIRDLGGKLRRTQAREDHAPLDDVQGSDMPTIVTEKDATKLSAKPGEFYALRMRVRFRDEEAVKDWLMQNLSR
jgi:tetraacyldisaccharide 4'-kinase